MMFVGFSIPLEGEFCPVTSFKEKVMPSVTEGPVCPIRASFNTEGSFDNICAHPGD
jgi:hypothetical protein